MTPSNLEVEYLFDQELARQIHLAVHERPTPFYQHVIRGFIWFSVAGGGFWYFAVEKVSASGLVMSGTMGALLGVIGVAVSLSDGNIAAASHAKQLFSKSEPRIIRVAVDANGASCTDSERTWTLAWSGVHSVTIDKEWIKFRTQNQVWLVVPTSAFADRVGAESFVTMANAWRAVQPE
jgi:hypothetical protein